MNQKLLDRAHTLNDKGAELYHSGDYHAARRYYEKSLDIKLDLLGADDCDTASTLSNLGIALMDLGDLEQAKSYFEKYLNIVRRKFGETRASSWKAPCRS